MTLEISTTPRPLYPRGRPGGIVTAGNDGSVSSSTTLVHIETNVCTVKVSACRDQYQSSVECDTASTSHMFRTFS